MRNLILAVLSVFALVSCTSNGSNEELCCQNWGDTYTRVPDPLQEYTAIIYEHSQECIARVSPRVVQACLIGPGGIDRNDFAAFVELDKRQAQKCYNMLLSYHKYDRRFYRPNTLEYKVWNNFYRNRYDYRVLFSDKL